MTRDDEILLAEKKIDDRRQKNANQLDLSNMNLTELPVSLGQLTQLESLDLSYNKLTTLPEWLGQLTNLKWLNLSQNQLTRLPASFKNLYNLQKIYLGVGARGAGNPLENFPAEIRNFKQLELLWMIDCNLQTIPSWISELNNLDDLRLAANHLEELPMSIGNLLKLTTLKLEFNDIVDLPSSLSQPRNLRELGLDHNPLHPELAVAYKQGIKAVKTYLRSKALGKQVIIYEAKLILIGEGEVGKSSLLGALRGDPFMEGLPRSFLPVDSSAAQILAGPRGL
jgi:Leucine-rich repeat (LRR) protein